MSDAQNPDFGRDGFMKWQRVCPPLHWRQANAWIVADRHLPDGRRQHMVLGSVAAGTVVANADVIGEDDVKNPEFASEPSALSSPFPFGKLSQTQVKVLRWIGGGWWATPGAGNTLLIKGKRVCTASTMGVLYRMGLVRRIDRVGWCATEYGKTIAAQLK